MEEPGRIRHHGKMACRRAVHPWRPKPLPLSRGNTQLDWVCRAHICSRASLAIRLNSELGRQLYEGQLEEFVGSRLFQAEVASRRRLPHFIDQRLAGGLLPGRELDLVVGSVVCLSS